MLILSRGEKRFLGTIAELRSRFANAEGDDDSAENTSLENIFFRAIEATPEDSDAVAQVAGA